MYEEPLPSPNSLSLREFECQNTACRSNASRQPNDENFRQIMKNSPDPHQGKVTGESFSFCFDPLIWQMTPTKWTALQLKLFNCSLISFIILLIQISAVSSEWKICISWIILTRGPFNFCQQYFTAPIRPHSHGCRSPPGMSADSTLLLMAPNHPGAVRSHGHDYYYLL